MNIMSGDLVQLKSEGPVMTVSNWSDNYCLRCVWFVGAELHEGLFSPPALVKVKVGSNEDDQS